jgi:hypothetical protein
MTEEAASGRDVDQHEHEREQADADEREAPVSHGIYSTPQQGIGNQVSERKEQPGDN